MRLIFSNICLEGQNTTPTPVLAPTLGVNRKYIALNALNNSVTNRIFKFEENLRAYT